MPVKIVSGDLFRYPAPAIAHGCNTVGHFEAGVAGLVKRDFPEASVAYQRLVFDVPKEDRPLLLGNIQFVRIDRTGPGNRTHVKYIVNLFTQIYGGPDARVEAIGESIGRLVEWAEGERITEVAIPMIGAGIGGLGKRWPEVLEAIVEAVADSLVTITIVRLP